MSASKMGGAFPPLSIWRVFECHEASEKFAFDLKKSLARGAGQTPFKHPSFGKKTSSIKCLAFVVS